MFKIGDYVAHYKEGVCEVVNIGKIDMGSSDKEYYTLKPVYDAGGTVYTPVDNKRDQIRKLITKEEAEPYINENTVFVEGLNFDYEPKEGYITEIYVDDNYKPRYEYIKIDDNIEISDTELIQAEMLLNQESIIAKQKEHDEILAELLLGQQKGV